MFTLWGDTFTANAATQVVALSVPAGLTAVFTRDSATQVTMTLTGRATSHAGADDVSNLGFAFGNGAFPGGDQTAVVNWARSSLTIDFMDAAITYTGGFTEAAANDGSVEGSVVFTLWGDTFTANAATQVVALSVPAGLTAVFTRDSATQVTMTLTGRATSHAGADDVSNLGFAFVRNGAFPGGDQTAVVNWARSSLTIDFMDAAITYTGGFTEAAANDGSVSGSVVMTLWGDTFASSLVSGADYGHRPARAGRADRGRHPRQRHPVDADADRPGERARQWRTT